MKKISSIISIVVVCLVIGSILLIAFTEGDPTKSNKGKLVLDETMIMVLEDGFELDGRYDRRLCPNGQLALTRANRTILEVEEEKGVDIDYEFVDYEMIEYSKIDDYNYVAKMKLQGKNAAGEYSYFETDVYFFCVEADTVGGFDLQAECEGLEAYVKDLI
jgi:hypothetical protein